MAKESASKLGLLQKGLLLEPFNSLCGKLHKYRVDPELHEARKTILRFVTGLRFSALLIYNIRTILRNTNLAANWGAILKRRDKKCSPECDIIVHTGSEWAWDGEDDVGGPVMDFHFVPQENVKLVVSCKSCLTQIDGAIRNDIAKLSDWVDNVWLFAECCQCGQVSKLRRDSRHAGYKRFSYLYTLKKTGGPGKYDERGWFSFAQALRALAGEG
jgi:hypothetical protein